MWLKADTLESKAAVNDSNGSAKLTSADSASDAGNLCIRGTSTENYG